MSLVGFAGLKNSGKNAAAEVLKADGYVEVKFAGALKEMLRAYLRYINVDSVEIERMIDGDMKEEPSTYFGGKTPREAMQTLGTEWGRDLIHPNIWTNSFLRHAGKFAKVVCTDVRFPNEVELIKRVNGTVVLIERPDGVQDSFADHSSETLVGTLLWDQHILNDGSLEDFQKAVASKFGMDYENYQANFSSVVPIKFTMEWTVNIDTANYSESTQWDCPSALTVLEVEVTTANQIDGKEVLSALNGGSKFTIHGQLA